MIEHYFDEADDDNDFIGFVVGGIYFLFDIIIPVTLNVCIVLYSMCSYLGWVNPKRFSKRVGVWRKCFRLCAFNACFCTMQTGVV